MGKLKNKIPSMLAIKEFTDNKRYTQRDLARGTNITESLMSRAMRSNTIDHLSLYDANAIANWLGCSIYDLFELSDEEIESE
jgi:transcriptional regulator with XRE-family HTH domain